MPHFLFNLKKVLGQEFWENVYYLQAADISAAVGQANNILGIEQNITKSTVHFVHMLVSEREQPFRNYKSLSMNLAGSVAPTGGELPLPLWNTVRCEFQPSNNGKPDVKQLRVPIYTDEIATVQTLTTTFNAFVQANYVLPLIALDCIEDDAGNAWTSGLTRIEIFDRQLKKRRRKKVVV